MNKLLGNFMRSGWNFSEEQSTLKNKFQLINMIFLTNIFGLSVGMSINYINKIEGLIFYESLIFIGTFIMIYLLRRSKLFVHTAIQIISFQYILLYSLLIYIGDPSDMKHVWIYTYPLILLNLQTNKQSLFWMILFLLIIAVVPIQPYIEVKYSGFQIFYILMVLSIVAIVTYFYQLKMTEANNTIAQQRLDLEKKYK